MQGRKPRNKTQNQETVGHKKIKDLPDLVRLIGGVC